MQQSTTAFVFCILSVVSYASGREIKFQNCGGEVKSVSVEPCSEEPCEIPRGESALISVHCVSNVNANELKLTVWADVAGFEVPYPGMKRNACVGKNITCPVTKNQDIKYTQKFEVKSFFPKIQTTAKFRLRKDGEGETDICCFKAPVKVV